MALERAAWLERRYGAEVVWHPFDLHPEYPPEGVPRTTVEARYADGFLQRMRELIQEAGFTYAPHPVVPNSMRSLEVSELARDRGRHADLHERLFRGYWSEGRDLGDAEALEELATAAGLDVGELREVLADGRYRERVARSTDVARYLGVDGVPAFLIDQKLLVVGAQPHEVFDRAMEQLGHPPRSEQEARAW